MDKVHKMDINHELEQIIEKYNLDAHYPAYRTSRMACAFIKNWIEKLSGIKDTFLFISMDECALQLINGWSIGDNISTLWISSLGDLAEYIMKLQNVDRIYIVSYTRTIEILHWLWRHDFRAESVYDVLENHHIYMQMEYYRFFTPLVDSVELNIDDELKGNAVDGSYLTLYEYYYQKQRLMHAVSMENNRRITEKLFFLAICMRNFLEAERIIKTMHHDANYEKCWSEIEKLIDRIRKTLTLQNQKHIIIYWLDCLRYEYAEKIEYLQERRNHSLYFHNAYTVTPYTHPTCRAMFCGVRQVDDLGYKVRYIGLDNSPLLKDISAQGYQFSVIGAYFRKTFDKKYNLYNENTHLASCSEVFWNLTAQMINGENPTVYLAHALMEIHPPCLSVRRNNFEKEFILDPEVVEGQIRELDGQLRFYDEMLGNSHYRVYMGDHGMPQRCPLNNMHVHFQIYHAAWQRREVNKLFCYLDFSKIMHQILIGEAIDDTLWNRDYVPIQDVDFYNPDKLKEMIRGTGLDELPFLTAYKGVVTGEYVYMHFKTGDELLHKWSDGLYVPVLGMNNAQKDSELFKELKEMAGEFPKELGSDLKFSYASNTYTVYENVKKTVTEAAKLINEKFTGYANGSIAFLKGGYHSRQLYAMLTEENRRKIGGIIDQNPECLCKNLGYQVYRSGDEFPVSIKAVLLSTHDNLAELQIETKKTYSNLEIIDIYEYWKGCGYLFTRDFWYGLEEDYEITNLLEVGEEGKNEIALFVELQNIVGDLSKNVDIPQERSRLFRDLRHEAEWFSKKKNLDVGAYINVIYENVKKTIEIAAKLLNEKFAGYEDGSIALRSGGYHTRQICAILTRKNQYKIGGIIDGFAQCACENLGYKIYKPDETLPKNIKAVLLSSYLNLDELKTEADQLYDNLEIIDIYQYWKDCGYCFWKDFWFGIENDWKVDIVE